MNCPSCGKQISENSLACPHCSAVLSPSQAPGAPAALPEAAPTPTPDAAPAPAFISLRRPPQLTAALTKFDVYIDNLKVGTLRNNDRGQFEVTPGVHTLYLKIDDFKSKTLSIGLQPGQTLRLVCTSKAFGLGVTIGFE